MRDEWVEGGRDKERNSDQQKTSAKVGSVLEVYGCEHFFVLHLYPPIDAGTRGSHGLGRHILGR